MLVGIHGIERPVDDFHLVVIGDAVADDLASCVTADKGVVAAALDVGRLAGACPSSAATAPIAKRTRSLIFVSP